MTAALKINKSTLIAVDYRSFALIAIYCKLIACFEAEVEHKHLSLQMTQFRTFLLSANN